MRMSSRMGFSHRKLSDGEAHKVKPNVAIQRCERVGHFGFAWFEFSSHVFEPLSHAPCCLIEHLF